MNVAVMIPCYNEEETIGDVVADFRRCIPSSTVYVYDNNSTDDTALVAGNAGAIVRQEPRQGKGFVVQRMFSDIIADTYILVDGDSTYSARDAGKMIECLESGADMVVGDRISSGEYSTQNKRRFHGFGNWLIMSLINILFGVGLKDIMSGYRVFSRRFVSNYPALCDGFEVETDMTIFALDHNFTIREVLIDYKDRPLGSVSKLSTFSDGLKIVVTVFDLFRYCRPLRFFGFLALVFFILSLIVGWPVILEYFKSQYVYRVPSAILAAALMIICLLTVTIGLILDSVRQNTREIFTLHIKKNETK